MGGKIEWKIAVADTGIEIILVGEFSENADLRGLLREITTDHAAKAVRLDLAKVRRINSDGLARWMRFVQELSATGVAVFLARCSPPVVHQMRLVPSFKSARIESVLVPYFCEDGCRQEYLQEVEVSVSPLARPAESLRCPNCGQQMVFDGVAELYEGLQSVESEEL
jgi:ABC-type transporter Mla MlaB component